MQNIQILAFGGCRKLDNIYISKNVNNISNDAFLSCISLKNIEIDKENIKYGYSKENGMLMDLENNNILFISDEVLNNITTFSIPEGITNFDISIGNYINITTLIIPKSLEKITNAILFPSSISNVEITDGNTNFIVENECLYNGNKTELIMCFTKEKEVTFAEETTDIRSFAFFQAVNIEEITIPDKVTRINSQILHPVNSKLKNINIGSMVTYIDPLFKHGNYYGTITIENPKYSIENNELYNKDKTELISVLHEIEGSYTIRSSVTKIGDRAFHSKNQMTEVILPDGLKEIGSSFQYCTGLTEIFIPNSVEKISSSAFKDATNLMHIRIDKAPNTIEGAPWGAISWDRAVEWLRLEE